MTRAETVVGRFVAHDDDGGVYTVIEYQKWIDAGSLGDPMRRLPASRRFALSTGEEVEYVGPETYKIVAADQLIRKID